MLMHPVLRYGDSREHMTSPEIGLDIPFLYPRPRSSRNENNVSMAADSPGSDVVAILEPQIRVRMHEGFRRIEHSPVL